MKSFFSLLVLAILFIIGHFFFTDESSVSILNQDSQVEVTRISFRDDINKEGRFYTYKNKEIVFQENKIDHLLFSPTKQKVGFLVNKEILDESIPYDRQAMLYIGNINKKDFQEIYHGSHRTAGWDWFSENEVIIYYSCGTECEALSLINVNSRERHDINYGVNYLWSPNKQFVLGYHYGWKYGMTVGDKNGKELFFIRRDHTFYEDEKLTEKTTALWSPDSSKLALVIKKESRDQMELLVFDVKNNFKQIFNQSLSDKEYNIKWHEQSKDILLNDKLIKI